jgi:hypothetical protein
MDTFEDDYPKNLYVIRRKLAALKRPVGFGDWKITIGPFNLSILPPYGSGLQVEYITQLVAVDINLREMDQRGNSLYVSLREDPRFKDYKPIMYNTFNGANGIVNMSSGEGMPILQLMELIKYLHRLANLIAFA